MTSLILSEMAVTKLRHTSRDERAQALCVNFVLQATNAQGLGMRLNPNPTPNNALLANMDMLWENSKISVVMYVCMYVCMYVGLKLVYEGCTRLDFKSITIGA